MRIGKFKMWSRREIDYLKRNYPKYPISKIRKHFWYRTLKSIQRKIQCLGLKFGTLNWANQEIKFLVKNYGKVSPLIISKYLNRSLVSIYAKAEKLGLKSKIRFILKVHKGSYTKKEDEFIKNYWGKLQVKQLKRKFFSIFKKRTLSGLQHRASRLGLHSELIYNCGNSNGMFGRNHTEKTKNGNREKHLKLWRNPYYAKKMFKLFALKPTLPEKQVIQIIKLNNLPFEYVGNGKVIIDSFNPDFLSRRFKLIIEVNGEYWHRNKNRERRKKRRYKSLGYQTLVIWSKELKDPQKVTQKIVNFVIRKGLYT